MLFKSRHQPTFAERLRLLIWPRRSFSRSFRYYGKRILRITASPHSVAAGLAVGIFAAFTPFWGFHVILAVILAYLFAGNIAAAILGTTFANPITLPFIWGGTYEMGQFILSHGEQGEHQALDLKELLSNWHFVEIWTPFIKPMLYGSSIVGVAFALFVYAVTRISVASYRHKRLQQIAERQENTSKKQGGVS